MVEPVAAPLTPPVVEASGQEPAWASSADEQLMAMRMCDPGGTPMNGEF